MSWACSLLLLLLILLLNSKRRNRKQQAILLIIYILHDPINTILPEFLRKVLVYVVMQDILLPTLASIALLELASRQNRGWLDLIISPKAV